MKAYYISPHFDDAIGSCGGRIHSDLVNGTDVYLITIFSKVTGPFSDYAILLHNYWKLSDPFNDRKNENFEACKSLGIKTINLEYEDAIYRKKDNIYLYPNDGDIFKPTRCFCPPERASQRLYACSANPNSLKIENAFSFSASV